MGRANGKRRVATLTRTRPEAKNERAPDSASYDLNIGRAIGKHRPIADTEGTRVAVAESSSGDLLARTTADERAQLAKITEGIACVRAIDIYPYGAADTSEKTEQACQLISLQLASAAELFSESVETAKYQNSPESLRVSVEGVIQRINRAEQAFHGALAADKSGNIATLTVAGQEVQATMREVRRQITEVEAELASSSSASGDTASVETNGSEMGAVIRNVNSSFDRLLPRVRRELRTAFPGVTFGEQLYEGFSEDSGYSLGIKVENVRVGRAKPTERQILAIVEAIIAEHNSGQDTHIPPDKPHFVSFPNRTPAGVASPQQ